MRTIKSNTVQFVVLEENERLKVTHLLPTTATSWQANLLIETVKATCTAWATGENDANGSPIIRTPSAEEVVSRAVDIVKRTIAELDANGWSVELVSAEDLLDDASGRVGFMGRQNGKADKGGEALPGARHPAAPDR